MDALFENRITPAGIEAIQDSIDHVAQEWQQTIQEHGEESPEAAQCLLALIAIEQIPLPLSEEAHARIQRYVELSEKIYGPHSSEAANGFLLLGRSHAYFERNEEAVSAFEKAVILPGGKRDFLPVESMLEALYQLFTRLKDNGSPESIRHAFVVALCALSWLATYYPKRSPSFSSYLERVCQAFKSWGFKKDVWEWLRRRCNWMDCDFTGLISVLLEEGMFPSEPEKLKKSCESKAEDDDLLKGYAISGIQRKHWSSTEGFSQAFPMSVAEGELSQRVEHLLAEGCRCLSTTKTLEVVFLVFSPHVLGKGITAFGPHGWTDSEIELMKETLWRVVAEEGADSAMMLAWIDLPVKETDEPEDRPTEAVMVVARDAKSYLKGLQPVRLIDGKYVFDEPMVVPITEGWFSEFTFPVQPSAKKPGRAAEKKKAKKKPKSPKAKQIAQATKKQIKSKKNTH